MSKTIREHAATIPELFRTNPAFAARNPHLARELGPGASHGAHTPPTPGTGAGAVEKERLGGPRVEEGRPGPVERNPVHRAKQKGKNVDPGSRKRCRVSVVFYVSNKGVRDNDGMLATILDVLITAGRRVAGFGDRYGANSARAEGPGGGGYSD